MQSETPTSKTDLLFFLTNNRLSAGTIHKYTSQETVKLIVQTSFAEKIKVEGSVTFENIFSSIDEESFKAGRQ